MQSRKPQIMQMEADRLSERSVILSEAPSRRRAEEPPENREPAGRGSFDSRAARSLKMTNHSILDRTGTRETATHFGIEIGIWAGIERASGRIQYPEFVHPASEGRGGPGFA
jgi:hypothetical protein